MIKLSQTPIRQFIKDPNYAWQLLECEIAIQMNQNIDGLAIAKLLELYMMGVQKLNSAMDIRQNYFLNKKTSLMSKATVIKTLSKPPMAKKSKPLQTTAKPQQSKSESQQKEIKKKKRNSKEGQQKTSKKVKIQQGMSSFALQQKKRQMQMRIAYQSAANANQNLTKIFSEFQRKQNKMMNKIKNVIDNHEQKLQERLNRRKLRTATYRSRPQQTNDTFLQQQDVDNLQNKKQNQPSFQTQSKNIVFMPNNDKYKKSKSLQNKFMHDLSCQQSPKKARRLTIDLTSSTTKLLPQLKPPQQQKQIEQFLPNSH